MKRVFMLVAAAATLAVVLLAVPLGASGDNERFVIGEQFHFTGPSSAAGTFSIAGAFNDSGTVASTFSVSPGGDDSLIVKGTDTFTGSLGTITAKFKARAFPASKPRVIIQGREVIVSATGTYTGVVGTNLNELGVVDTVTNSHTQTLDSGEGD
jgi:hypothetical protein